MKSRRDSVSRSFSRVSLCLCGYFFLRGRLVALARAGADRLVHRNQPARQVFARPQRPEQQPALEGPVRLPVDAAGHGRQGLHHRRRPARRASPKASG